MYIHCKILIVVLSKKIFVSGIRLLKASNKLLVRLVDMHLRPVSNVEFCMHRMQFKQCIMRKPI